MEVSLQGVPIVETAAYVHDIALYQRIKELIITLISRRHSEEPRFLWENDKTSQLLMFLKQIVGKIERPQTETIDSKLRAEV